MPVSRERTGDEQEMVLKGKVVFIQTVHLIVDQTVQ